MSQRLRFRFWFQFNGSPTEADSYAYICGKQRQCYVRTGDYADVANHERSLGVHYCDRS